MHLDMRSLENRHPDQDSLCHAGEVCSMVWSPDYRRLASGGNDNIVCLWDDRKRVKPFSVIQEHVAAVRALAWCPWRNEVLATGGGSADRKICLWEVKGDKPVKTDQVKTNSQVCSLLWAPNHKELVSSHGFSENSIMIWKPNRKTPLFYSRKLEFQAHSNRVLHTCLSPDGETLCSASGDETLKFWDVFSKRATKRRRKHLWIIENDDCHVDGNDDYYYHYGGSNGGSCRVRIRTASNLIGAPKRRANTLAYYTIR